MRKVVEPISLASRVQNIWSRFELSVECDLIDAQHMWLVAILIRMDELQSESDSSGDFSITFTDIIDYTTEHFDLEEGMLRESNYFDAVEHARQHIKFLASVKRHAREVSSGDPHSRSRLIQTLKKWIFTHILTEDRKYKEYFQSNGTDLNELAARSASNLGISLKDEQRELFENVMEYQISQEEATSSDNIQRIAGIWNKYKLSIGIPLVDMQHLWLIKQVVELDRVLRLDSAARSEKFQEAIITGVDYIKEHFTAEEKLMRHFNFHDFDSHVKQHRMFVEFIQERHKQSQQEDIAALTGLIHDLKEWLISHIAVEDKKLYYFFRKRSREVADYTRESIRNGEIVMRKGHMDLYQSIVQFK